MRRLTCYASIVLGINATAVEAWLMRTDPDLRHGAALLIAALFTAAAVHAATLADPRPAPVWLNNAVFVVGVGAVTVGSAGTAQHLTGWPFWTIVPLLAPGYVLAMLTTLALFWAHAHLTGQAGTGPKHVGRGDIVNPAGQVWAGDSDYQPVWLPGQTYQPAQPTTPAPADLGPWTVRT